MNKPSPSVFISYSHESEPHIQWVRKLAEDLTSKGIKTTLDQWHLHPGNEIGLYMERSVEENTYVLLICTEEYARKSNDRSGGVGYEQEIFVGEILTNEDFRSRIIAVLRSGEPSKAIPIYMKSRLFLDFRAHCGYEVAFEQLMHFLYRTPASLPPELGNHPDFIHESEFSKLLSPDLTLPTSSEPHAWICVAGTGSRWKKLSEKIKDTSILLGRYLARAGYGIVTGGWPGVDELTARSFARELQSMNIALENRLIQIIAKHRPPVFYAGNLLFVSGGEEEWEILVKKSDAIVLIEGVGGTKTTGEYGLKLKRVVLPIADTGGDAAKLYLYMQRHWQEYFLPAVERSRFQILGREAPDMVPELIVLLNEWHSKNDRNDANQASAVAL